MKRLVLWSGLALGGLLSASVQAETIDGGELYRENCAICHGDAGDGKTATQGGLTPRPRDFTSPEAAMELTRERMIYAVTNGRRGTAMMAHKGRFTPAEIEAVVDYVRDTFMREPAEVEEDAVAEPPLLRLGEAVYTQNCSVCHGDQGNTAYWARNGLRPPPRDFTGDEAKSILTRQRMITSVTYGRPGTGMQSFKSRLSDQEIEAVVSYIRYKFMGVAPNQDTGLVPSMQHNEPAPAAAEAPAAEDRHDAAPAVHHDAEPAPPHDAAPAVAESPAAAQPPAHAAPHARRSSPHASHAAGMPAAAGAASPGGQQEAADMGLPMPKGLTGDPLKGRDFFMKNCFSCHGIKGAGNGPRAYFNIPRPRDFTSPESRRVLNRPRIFDSIANGRLGTVMPAWGKVLDDQQIADIAEFVFRAFIQDVKAGGVAAAETPLPEEEGVEEKAGDAAKKKVP
ncbi:MAG TPA: c-type cytochrome [Gammaproteobacteria bacterium]|nr:c-type cytochrome [Gammaproteobacteria bacterium]